MTKRKSLSATKEPKPNGRPTKYSQEIATLICKVVAKSTLGIRRLCDSRDDFPCVDTVLEWKIKHPEFSSQYATAKQHQAELLADEIIEISDDSSRDEIDTEFGVKQNSEFINRSRLKVDSRKWVAAKLLPKVYGDRIQHEGNVTFTHEQALKELE